MGMFDNVTVKYPLPDAEVQDEGFQTKDLECLMENYTITAEGRLIHHTYRLEATPEQQMPYYGKPEWEQGGFYRVAGMFTEVDTGDVDTEFHGDLRINTYIAEVRYEYNIRFTHGAVEWVKRVGKRAGD